METCIPYAWQARKERIKIPCFKGKTWHLFGIWDAKKNLSLYSTENTLTSEAIIAFIDDFVRENKQKSIMILDNAPVHRSNLFKEKQVAWEKKGLVLFFLPTYSPHLNLIEHLWRFMKYVWIELDAYGSW